MRNLNSDEMEVVVGGEATPEDVDELGADEIGGADELGGANEPV